MSPLGSVNAVSLGTLVRIIAGVHDVTADRLPTLRGRFRNFLKFGFPDVAAVGKGSRAEYWPEHVAQVLVAFELVRYRVPQTAVAEGVARHRDVVTGAFGDAARELLAGNSGSALSLWVGSNALLEDAKKIGSANIVLVRERSSLGAVSASVWQIDVVRLVERAIEAASMTDEPLSAGFFARLTPDLQG